MDNSKFCNGCKIIKSRSEFYPRSKDKNHVQSKCKPCSIKVCAQYIKKNPENLKRIKKREQVKNKRIYLNRYYNKQYGISLKEYEQLLISQNNTCAICKQKCITGRALAVDHCHKTGKVRGLLCTKCNTGVGNFNDNKDLLYSACIYLSI